MSTLHYKGAGEERTACGLKSNNLETTRSIEYFLDPKRYRCCNCLLTSEVQYARERFLEQKENKVNTSDNTPTEISLVPIDIIPQKDAHLYGRVILEDELALVDKNDGRYIVWDTEQEEFLKIELKIIRLKIESNDE